MAVAIVDSAKGQIKAVNRFAQKKLGHSQEELLQRSLLDLSPPCQPCGRPSEQLFAEKSEAAIEYDDVDFEWTHTRPHGDAFPCRIKLVRLESRDLPLLLYCIHELTEQKKQDATVAQRDAILCATSHAASGFVRGSNWQDVVGTVLRELGEGTMVDRAYLFQCHYDDDESLLVSVRFEWSAEGAEPILENPDLQGFRVDGSGFEPFAELMIAGEPIYGAAKNFPPKARAFLQQHLVVSFICLPIIVNGEPWGFIGMDDCRQKRDWPMDLIEAMQAMADALAGAIERQQVREDRERLFNRSVDLMCIFAPDGRLKGVNPSFLSTLGYREQELLNQSLVDLLHPDDQASTLAEIDRIRHGSDAVHFENRCRASDGSYRWLAWTSPARLPGETVMFGVARDVTEHKRIEGRLRLTRYTLDQAKIAVFWYDILGRFTYVNNTACEWLGFSSEELLSMHVADVNLGLDKKNFANDWRHLKNDKAVRSDSLYQRCDGTTFPVEIHSTYMKYESDEFALEVVHDISERKRNELALRGSERRFREIFENEPDCVKLLDRGGHVIDINSAGLAMIGATSIDEVRGGCVYDFVSPEHRAAFTEAVQAVFCGESRKMEYEITALDGRRLWMDTHQVPLHDSNGDISSLLAITRDVTQRRRAQTWLNDQNRILELLTLGADLRDVLNMFVKSIEKQFEGAIGSVLLLDEDRRLRPGAAPSLPEEYARSVDGLKIGPNSGSCGASAHEKRRIVVPDTFVDPRWANYRDLAHKFQLRSCWSQPICSRNGKVLGTFALYHRKERVPEPGELEFIDNAVHLVGLAIQRRRDEHKLRFTQFSVDCGLNEIYWIRPDGQFFYVNEAASRSLGYSADELKQMYIWDISTDFDADQWLALCAEAKQKRLLKFERTHRSKDGKIFPIEITLTYMTYEGQSFFVAFAVDITDRKESEAELQRHRDELVHVSRLSTMGEMATGLAHELNQPLTAIANNACVAELALAGDAPDLSTLRKTSIALCEQAVRAGEIVNRLRGFVNKAASQRMESDLNCVVSESLKLVESELRNSAIDVDACFAANLPSVEIDSIQIQQVLVNLIRNSVDAMSALPRIDRHLRISTQQLSSSHVEVRVRDFGEGFSNQEMVAIFKPFYTTKPKGMGMGLAISRTIVEAHSGRLVAEQGTPKGALFRVMLPTSTQN